MDQGGVTAEEVLRVGVVVTAQQTALPSMVHDRAELQGALGHAAPRMPRGKGRWLGARGGITGSATGNPLMRKNGRKSAIGA